MSTLVQSGYTDYYEYDAAHKEGYNLDAKYIAQQIQEHYNEARTPFQAWQNHANEDIRMLSGDQQPTVGPATPWTASPPVQNTLTFNRILRADNMIGGHQRRNRKQSIIRPEHENPESQSTADQQTKVLGWMFNKDRTYDKISTGFDGARATGLCLHHLWMDYSHDSVSGDLCSGILSYNQFMMDPFWENPDLSDCRWIMYRRWKHKEQAAEDLPDRRQEILAAPSSGGQGDDKFPYLPYAYNYAIKGMVSWDEYWNIETREQLYLKDRETREMIRWKLPKWMAKEWVITTQGRVEMVYKRVPTIRRTVLVGNRPMYTEVQPWGLDRYPFAAYLCYFYPQLQVYANRFQGVVRVSKDAQMMYNRRKTANLAILESQIDSGFIFEEDALVKNENIQLTGPGRFIAIKRGKMGAVQQLPPPRLDATSMENENGLGGDVPELMGITEELLGIADSNDISGLLSKMRQGAALTGLNPIFEKLDMTQIQVSEIALEMAQHNFSINKLRKILNQEPAQEFKSKDFSQYSCQVSQTTMTEDQKQLEFIQLLQLQQVTGIKVPSEMFIDTATITNKNKLKEALQAQEMQQQQALQQQEELQVEQVKTAIAAMQADAINKAASARERDTRAISNIGLAEAHYAQSSHERAETILSNAKTIKEMEGMEQQQIIEAITLLNSLRQEEESADMADAQQQADIAARRTNKNADTVEV